MLLKLKSFLRAVTLSLTLFISNALQAQCLTTAAHAPSVVTNDNSVGIFNFSSLTNIIAPDGQYASAQATAIILSGSTNYLRLTGFGFSLPPYATICGIEVRVNKRATGINIFTSVKDNTVRLIKGGNITGNNAATTTGWGSTTNYATYGGANADWGVALTAADVNSPDFGLAISVTINGIATLFPSAEIDNVELLVSYNTVLPITITNFQSSLDRNEVRNSWLVTEQEAGASVVVQRTTGSGAWQNIHTLSDFSNPSGYYTFTDKLSQKGAYLYRLMVLSASGKVHYSPVNVVKYDTDLMHLYPSVATTFVTITSGNGKDLLRVYNSNGALQHLPVSVLPTGTRIDVTSLQKGYYVVATPAGIGRFIRQ